MSIRDQSTPQSKGPKRVSTGGMPPASTWLWFLGIVAMNYLLAQFLMPSAGAPVTVAYTFFKQEAGKGNVKAIYSQGEKITGKFSTPITYPPASESSADSSAKSTT